MENIIILVFSSFSYNLDELKNMSAADRIYLANFAKTVGYDETDVLTPAQYQDLFNAGEIDPNFCYVFFENNA